MSSHRRARSQDRAREFGRGHPRLTLVIVGAALTGVVAICAVQLRHGVYLGRGWLIGALAGMAAAAALAAAAVISDRRHSPAAGRFRMAWLVLGLLSASAIRYPFFRDHYGGVQAFFNVMMHAVLLGYEAVTCAAIVALLAYLLVRPRGLPGPAALQPPPVRLRFPSATSPTWRPGSLIAANGTLTWLSLNGEAEVDLTSACQALPLQPADTHKSQRRTTTLASASGLVEVDVSPRTLETLASCVHRWNVR